MRDPFDLSDAVIRDFPHVRVARLAPQGGRPCEYRKWFKPGFLSKADYWIARENEFLLDFKLKKLRHTVEFSSIAQGGDGARTAVLEMVATRDAGITLEDWLRVRPLHANGMVWAHPFHHVGLFLELLRGCLAALKEIHALGIIHCDIKEDNICLPYTPSPFREGQAMRLEFERIRLIDFAFSITPERPLEHALPIQPTAPYQSELLKAALRQDQEKPQDGQWAVQQLDWRVDLFSLGYLAGYILDGGLLQPQGSGGLAALQGAHALVNRLKSFDNSGARFDQGLPHEDLIGEIDGWLGTLVDVEAYRHFAIGSIYSDADQEAGTPLPSGALPTPLVYTDPNPTPLNALTPPAALPATDTVTSMTKIFISYAQSSAEHMKVVNDFVEVLRQAGFEVSVDADVANPQGPPKGWPLWMSNQIKAADWVLMFFDEAYSQRFAGDSDKPDGRGSNWEINQIRNELHHNHAQNNRFIPLLVDNSDVGLIPDELKGYSRYFIPSDSNRLAQILANYKKARSDTGWQGRGAVHHHGSKKSFIMGKNKIAIFCAAAIATMVAVWVGKTGNNEPASLPEKPNDVQVPEREPEAIHNVPKKLITNPSQIKVPTLKPIEKGVASKSDKHTLPRKNRPTKSHVEKDQNTNPSSNTGDWDQIKRETDCFLKNEC